MTVLKVNCVTSAMETGSQTRGFGAIYEIQPAESLFDASDLKY
jgi:hypothetical protein